MRTLAGATAAVLAVNASVAATTATPVRTRLLPGLAGVGRPDHVALTFDDGPDRASTPLFLKALDELGVRATFFLLGAMLDRDPGLGRELVEAGHEVAVHGWHHRAAVFRGPRALHADIARARDLIATVTGESPVFYRPPYGVLTATTVFSAHRLGLRPVLWTAWARDWSAATTAEHAFRITTRTLRGGGTVLLHDSDCTAAPGAWRTTLRLLPQLVSHCQDQGLAIGPVREHGI